MNIKLAIKKKIGVKISVDTGWRVAVEWVTPLLIINTTTLKKSACQENGGDTNLTASPFVR